MLIYFSTTWGFSVPLLFSAVIKCFTAFVRHVMQLTRGLFSWVTSRQQWPGFRIKFSPLICDRCRWMGCDYLPVLKQIGGGGGSSSFSRNRIWTKMLKGSESFFSAASDTSFKYDHSLFTAFLRIMISEACPWTDSWRSQETKACIGRLEKLARFVA